jgi:hypothetical protein
LNPGLPEYETGRDYVSLDWLLSLPPPMSPGSAHDRWKCPALRPHPQHQPLRVANPIEHTGIWTNVLLGRYMHTQALIFACGSWNRVGDIWHATPPLLSLPVSSDWRQTWLTSHKGVGNTQQQYILTLQVVVLPKTKT